MHMFRRRKGSAFAFGCMSYGFRALKTPEWSNSEVQSGVIFGRVFYSSNFFSRA